MNILKCKRGRTAEVKAVGRAFAVTHPHRLGVAVWAFSSHRRCHLSGIRFRFDPCRFLLYKILTVHYTTTKLVVLGGNMTISENQGGQDTPAISMVRAIPEPELTPPPPGLIIKRDFACGCLCEVQEYNLEASLRYMFYPTRLQLDYIERCPEHEHFPQLVVLRNNSMACMTWVEEDGETHESRGDGVASESVLYAFEDMSLIIEANEQGVEIDEYINRTKGLPGEQASGGLATDRTIPLR